MLDINYLKEYEYPPAGEDWIAVIETPRGEVAIIVGLSRDRDSVYCLAAEKTLDLAIERAKSEAMRFGLERLYVIEFGSLAK